MLAARISLHQTSTDVSLKSLTKRLCDVFFFWGGGKLPQMRWNGRVINSNRYPQKGTLFTISFSLILLKQYCKKKQNPKNVSIKQTAGDNKQSTKCVCLFNKLCWVDFSAAGSWLCFTTHLVPPHFCLMCFVRLIFHQGFWDSNSLKAWAAHRVQTKTCCPRPRGRQTWILTCWPPSSVAGMNEQGCRLGSSVTRRCFGQSADPSDGEVCWMRRCWISALQRLKASGTPSEGSVATRHCEECELQHTARIRRKPPSGHTHVSVATCH